MRPYAGGFEVLQREFKTALETARELSLYRQRTGMLAGRTGSEILAQFSSSKIQSVVMTSLLRKDLSNYSGASNLAHNERIKELIAQGQKIYHLGFGQSPFPIPECFVEGLKQNAHRHEYLSVKGLMPLREQVLKFHRDYDEVDHFHPDFMVTGAGSKEILYLALTVFGYDVLLPSPAWTTYFPQTHLAGRKVHVIPSFYEENFLLTGKRLEEFVVENCYPDTPKLLILNTPNNPSGQVHTAEQLKELTEVCRKHRVIVMSDEIYARLAYKGDHVSIAKVWQFWQRKNVLLLYHSNYFQFYKEGTILTSGFSKWASAGGWRAGYGIFPIELKEFYDAVASAGSHTYTCCPAPMQHALIYGLQQREELDDYIVHCRNILGGVGRKVHEKLGAAGVKAPVPQGGYYFMPDFGAYREKFEKNGITKGSEMCEAMLNQAKVALMPCDPFYLRPVGELTTRLCFINFDGGPALDAARKLGTDPAKIDDEFLYKYCRPTMEATDELVKWLQD